MDKYNEMQTHELIALLYSLGSDVEMGLIMALANRGEEAAGPLREALADEENWYEGSDGKYWIVQHAMAILGLIGDEKALPLIFEMLPHAYFADHQAGIDSIAVVIASFGAPALPFCRDFITSYRGAWRDNPDYSYCRYKAAVAMTLIARNDDALRRDASDFICGLYEDETEDDETFLSFSVSCPVALDHERGFKAIRKAYDRGLIDESICGAFSRLRASYDSSSRDFFIDLDNENNTIDYFYRPAQINERLNELEEQANEKLYWDVPDMGAPAGFQLAEHGNLVNPVKVGRNDPCPCGSTRKYKKCCGAK